MAPTLEEIGSAQYVMLTTFRKDGSAIGTAVWAALDGQELLVWTVADSYKVRRIRHNPAVTIAACGLRGEPKGESIDASAMILDAAGTERARKRISKKYGILGWLSVQGSVLRRGKTGTVGLSIRVA